MAANHELALAGRDRVAAALGVAAPAPDAMLGAMAALPVPGRTSDQDGAMLAAHLVEEGIELPIVGWPVRGARRSIGDAPASVLLRVSAQRYNEPADYDRLAGALGRRPTAE